MLPGLQAFGGVVLRPGPPNVAVGGARWLVLRRSMRLGWVPGEQASVYTAPARRLGVFWPATVRDGKNQGLRQGRLPPACCEISVPAEPEQK